LTIFQISKLSQSAEKNGSPHKALDERPENYLTHPTLGLLYSVCPASDNVELFTTLYAKRIFFLVTSDAEHLNLESIGRQEARLFVERRLYDLRRLGQSQEYDKLMVMYQQTFG
jgi:PII interaction protein X